MSNMLTESDDGYKPLPEKINKRYEIKSVSVTYDSNNIWFANYLMTFLKLLGLHVQDSYANFNDNFSDSVITLFGNRIQFVDNEMFQEYISRVLNDIGISDKREMEDYYFLTKLYYENNIIHELCQIIDYAPVEMLPKMIDDCISITTILRNYIKEHEDSDVIPIKMFYLSFAYNINARLKHVDSIPFTYTPESMLRVCDKIISNSNNEHYVGAAKLLKAKIDINIQDFISVGFNILEELFPNNDVMFYRGSCYMRCNGDYTPAIMCYRRCYGLIKAIFMQGDCEYFNKDYDRAMQDLTRFVDIIEQKINDGVASPEDIVLLYNSYTILGNIYFNKFNKFSNVDTSIQYYEKAVEVYNDVISLINWSGVIKYKNDIDLITQNIKSVLKIKAVYSSLSIAYSVVGDRANSEKYYELEESCK